jgi:predicted PurR-regulated permease PerM
MLVLAVIYTLYFASALFVPLVAAVLLYQLLHRPVRALGQVGIPLPAAAAVTLLALFALIGVASHFLVEPAEQWLRDAPASLGELRRELQRSAGALDELRELGEEIDELANMADDDANVPVVQIRAPGHLQALTGVLPTVIAEALLTFVTCFFLLVQGDQLGRNLVSLGRTREARRRISNLLRGIHQQISTYLTTVTLINLGLGIVVAVVLYLLGVPHPHLWGMLAGVLNFAPYIGAALNAFVLTVVGIMTFESLGEALLVPGAYLALTALEGMVVTPMILGRRVLLSSLWVFLAVVFWGWMWGAIGALMAVPLTVSLMVIWKSCRDHDPFHRQKTAAVAPAGT